MDIDFSVISTRISKSVAAYLVMSQTNFEDRTLGGQRNRQPCYFTLSPLAKEDKAKKQNAI